MIEPWGDPPRPRVVSETVTLDGKPAFEFAGGEVHLFNDRFERQVTYPFDWSRSALATIIPRRDNQLLTRFKLWLSGLLCFRINPFAMGLRAEGENLAPNVDLSNIAAWYHKQDVDDQIAGAAAALFGWTRTNAVVPEYCIQSLRLATSELKRLE